MESVPILAFDPAAPRSELTNEVGRWLASDALTQLIDAFSGPATEAGASPLQRAESLAEFSEVWDFRRGEERNLAASKEFAASHSALILEAASALGLVESTAPKFEAYDHVVVLGGLVRACVLRPRLASQLLKQGIHTDSITGIGAYRPLGGDEPALAAAAGIAEVQNEFEAMDAGMRAAFGLAETVAERGEEHPENPNLSWHVSEYPWRDSRISVVAAPTTDPARRANTPDSYRYLAEELVNVSSGSRVLLVTSAIYIPFQHADAIRMLGLPYGAVVDTVGVDTTTVREPELRQTFTPALYLQEIRSSILSMRNLLQALP